MKLIVSIRLATSSLKSDMSPAKASLAKRSFKVPSDDEDDIRASPDASPDSSVVTDVASAEASPDSSLYVYSSSSSPPFKSIPIHSRAQYKEP